MPIDANQWRASVGLLNASRMPRSLVALKGTRHLRRHPAQPILSGAQGFSLLLTSLIVVQMLLIIAGDVELNPGPPKKQTTPTASAPSSVDTEVLVQHHPQLDRFLNVPAILPYLYRRGLLSPNQLLQGDKVNKLLVWLPKNDPGYLRDFIQCLRESAEEAGVAHTELADSLEVALENQQEETGDAHTQLAESLEAALENQQEEAGDAHTQLAESLEAALENQQATPTTSAPSSVDTEVLMQYHLQLDKFLNFPAILPYLNRHGLLPPNQLQDFVSPLPPLAHSEKVNKLLVWLPKNDPGYLRDFIQCLRESAEEAGVAHTELADSLEVALENQQGAVPHADTALATSVDTRAAYQDRIKLLEKEIQEKETVNQQLSQDVKNLESKQAKLQEELYTTQKELSEVEVEHSVQKTASESLQEQLVESECRTHTAEQESHKTNQQLQTVLRERDELAAVVEFKDKQLDWERKELDEYKRAHSRLHSAVSRQERELDHLREDYAQILDHHSTYKHDPSYPGVCFFGDPLQESIDSSGRLIQWPQVGITLDIPPGAVSSGEVLYLSIWPCLSGPYVLPPDFELVSPAYLIKPAFHFKKPVMLSLVHFARLSTDEDCDEMTFVSAHFSPETTGEKPEYHFRALDKGSFRRGENVGTICITHFCARAVARKRKRKQEIPSKQRKDADLECSVPQDVEYSLLLYHNKSIPYKRDGYAIFAVSLCHVLYLENLSKDIKEQFPGIQFWLFQKHRVQMTRDAVEVKCPRAVGRWRIEPDRKPLSISQKDVDLPHYHPELSRSKEHYPPRILLTITSPQEGAEDAKCSLRVVGVSEHVEFLMQLKREKQPESNETLSLSPPHSSATLGERPTLRVLLAFPAREGMLNIPDMIGTRYIQLGIFLLEDDTGTKVRAFRTQYQDEAQTINIEVLAEWLHGRGKQPVTWKTLIEVLHIIGLNSLADSIAVVKY